MKDFSQTAASSVDVNEFDQQTNWMSLKEAQGHTLVVMSANKANTKYGVKYFVHVIIEGDEEAVEYTISASEQSAIFAQITAIVDADGADGFPFRCVVKPIGRTFQLDAAPPRRQAPAARPRPVPAPDGDSPF